MRSSNLSGVSKPLAVAVVTLLVTGSQWLPRRADLRAAEYKAVGGCGGGLCLTNNFTPCPVTGDACGGVSQCSPSDDGPFICTLKSYCTSAGCGGVVDGGACH